MPSSYVHYICAIVHYEQEKRAVYRVFLGGGSGFSSPCVSCSTSFHLIYTATLRGIVSAVHAVSQFSRPCSAGKCALQGSFILTIDMLYTSGLFHKIGSVCR